MESKKPSYYLAFFCALGISLIIGLFLGMNVPRASSDKSYYRLEMYQDSFKVIDPEDKRVIGVYPYSDSSEVSKQLLRDNL